MVVFRIPLSIIPDIQKIRDFYNTHIRSDYEKTTGELFVSFDSEYRIHYRTGSTTDLSAPSVVRLNPRDSPDVAFAAHTHPYRKHPFDGPSSQDHLIFNVYNIFLSNRCAHFVFDNSLIYVITPNDDTTPIRQALKSIADDHADDHAARDAAALYYVNSAIYREFKGLTEQFTSSLLGVDHLIMSAPVMTDQAEAFRYQAANAKIAGTRVRVYPIDGTSIKPIFDSLES